MAATRTKPDYRKVLLANDLSIQRALGKGLQGHVFHVRHPSRPELAVKIADDTSEIPDNIDRLQREFVILKGSDADVNLLKAYEFDYFLDKDTNISYAWFTMELCKGTLQEMIQITPMHDRIKHAYNLLNSLAYLHRKKTSHRDIKLSNLLVDQAEHLKLGDLGAAKVIRRPLQAGEETVPYLLGTTPYIAPELWTTLENPSLSAPDWFLSDEYAAGVCVYQILSRGLLPPRLQSCLKSEEGLPMQRAMRDAHRGGVFWPVRVPEHPSRPLPQVDRVLQKMLSINPIHRYGNLTECALAMVSAFINHELMTQGSNA